MADKYTSLINSSNNNSSGGGGWRSMRNEEFNEEDVWAVVKERKDSNSKIRKSKDSSPVSTLRRLPTASRMIPRSDKSSTTHHVSTVFQQSAPVNIPDWSKIYTNPSRKKASWGDDDDDDDDDDVNVDDDEEFNEEEDTDMVPPHEWLAKKLARSQISSFSVFEGVGRTLKGRDLSKVRDAVLSRTGFIE